MVYPGVKVTWILIQRTALPSDLHLNGISIVTICTGNICVVIIITISFISFIRQITSIRMSDVDQLYYIALQCNFLLHLRFIIDKLCMNWTDIVMIT